MHRLLLRFFFEHLISFPFLLPATILEVPFYADDAALSFSNFQSRLQTCAVTIACWVPALNSSF